MQAANPPVRYVEAFNLTTLGLSAELFKPGVLGFESEKYVSISEQGVSIFEFSKKLSSSTSGKALSLIESL